MVSNEFFGLRRFFDMASKIQKFEFQNSVAQTLIQSIILFYLVDLQFEIFDISKGGWIKVLEKHKHDMIFRWVYD